MDKLKIGTFNTKDNKINSNGGLREDGINNADVVSNIIKENEFDYLCTQELTITYVNELIKRMPQYKFYGKYRYGNLLTHIPYNENNQIITNQKIIDTKTIWLPWVANNIKDLKTSITKMSIMPRIATIVILDTEDKRKICIINTHLDYQIPSIQTRQLQKLKELIEKYGKDYEIILTGDFNMTLNDNHFNSFIKDVNDKITHVDINQSTWHGKNGEEKTLDHIFIPKDWKVEDAGVIDSKNTSDHDIVFADIKRK